MLSGLLCKCKESSCNPCSCNHGQAIIQPCTLFVTWLWFRGWHMERLSCVRKKKRFESTSNDKHWPLLLLNVDAQLLIFPHHERLGKMQNNPTDKCHHIWTLSQSQRELVSRRRLSRSVHNTFKYVNICSPAGRWGQFDPSGAKPTVARCFNKIQCAAVALQHPAQTLSFRFQRFDLTGEEPKESMDHCVLELLK